MSKKCILFIIIIFSVSVLSAQEKTKLPSVDLKTLEGTTINTSEFGNDGKPYIISFWATWCKPCKKELNTIAEVYEEWQEETGVKLIAISIDDSRTAGMVSSIVYGNDWKYEVYLDSNSDLKRAMSVNMIPHTFIIDGNNKIVWQHTSFSEGSEIELINLIKKLNAGEDISSKH
ncbi:MAG: alkyl hydroperoxide reductase [Bacteroidetes bacterium HGW-Bacteroidetes-12]|nr:MAG: alkyl hydroperoxide reductase [Bacteroidetes bacterium HGW-Bacteroidetes-12]